MGLEEYISEDNAVLRLDELTRFSKETSSQITFKLSSLVARNKISHSASIIDVKYTIPLKTLKDEFQLKPEINSQIESILNEDDNPQKIPIPEWVKPWNHFLFLDNKDNRPEDTRCSADIDTRRMMQSIEEAIKESKSLEDKTSENSETPPQPIPEQKIVSHPEPTVYKKTAIPKKPAGIQYDKKYERLVIKFKDVLGYAPTEKWLRERTFDVDKFIKSNARLKSLEDIVKTLYSERGNRIIRKDLTKILTSLFPDVNTKQVTDYMSIMKAASYVTALGRSPTSWEEITKFYSEIPKKDREKTLNHYNPSSHDSKWVKEFAKFPEIYRNFRKKGRYDIIEILLEVEPEYCSVIETYSKKLIEKIIINPNLTVC